MEPANPKYASWSKARRFEAAVKKCVHEKWTQVEAAREFGVSRQQLNPKVQKYRAEHDARVEAIRQESAGPMASALSPLGLNERRRLPGTFQEFDDWYFGHWQCPDCGKNHKREPFHDDIIEAVLGDYRRTVINVPPYHAKTTYGTIKTTAYRVCQNPNVRRILISKSQTFAGTFLQSLDQLFTNHELYLPGRNLIDDFGPFKPDGAQSIWNNRQIYVAGRVTAEKDPTVQVLGVGNQIYGRRADEIIADDCADTENQRNPEQVLKMMEWFDKMVSTRVGKSGKLVWIGTRVHAGDIYSILKLRQGYRVVTLPCILDDSTESVLWPDHFPYSQAMVHRAEMSAADFQLVFQNVDIPGLSASFPPEMIEECKDHSRVVGHFDPQWRLIAGLDPAASGYTAFTLLGIDLRTGNRFLVDQVAVKGMRAPQMRDQIFDWTERYPIYEWRVEANGLQAQIVQYNEEIIKHLALRGVRVVPHFTGSNKWDPQFGVESTAPLFATGMMSIPWGNQTSAQTFQPFIEQLVAFPMGVVNDRVMSFWFADLGCRDHLKRGHLPLFNERMRVPRRVRARRHIVDFYANEVRPLPVSEQIRATRQDRSGRQVVGRPARWSAVEDAAGTEPRRFVNVPGFVNPDHASPVGG